MSDTGDTEVASRSGNSVRWWGELSFDVGQRGYLRLGPTELSIYHGSHEWRVSRRTVERAEAPEFLFEVPSDRALDEDESVVHRFSFDRDDRVLWLTPRLADRGVVVVPELPFFVPAGQHITLYCSTPLWLKLAAGSDRVVLEEFPLYRPPDTWFGPSTREGELCYAARSTARLDRSQLGVRPHRAFTELALENRTSRTVPLDKVNLSVPYLSLYETASEGFWTNRLQLSWSEESSLAELEVGEGPPEGLDAELVSGPRLERGENVMVRAFGALFSSGG